MPTNKNTNPSKDYFQGWKSTKDLNGLKGFFKQDRFTIYNKAKAMVLGQDFASHEEAADYMSINKIVDASIVSTNKIA